MTQLDPIKVNLRIVEEAPIYIFRVFPLDLNPEAREGWGCLGYLYTFTELSLESCRSLLTSAEH